MIRSIYNDIELAAGGVAAISRLQGGTSCSSFASLSEHLSEFSNIYEQIQPNFSIAAYCSNCEEMHGWYSHIAINQTCSKSPTLLASSLILICILAILSVGLTSLGIVWKTDMQLFLEISGVSDIDDESFDEESFDEELTRRKTIDRLNSVRFRRVQAKQADFSVITEDQIFNKEASEKKIQLWRKLLKKSQRSKKMTKHVDSGKAIEEASGNGEPEHDEVRENTAGKNILRQIEWSRGKMATPDNPVHRGEVEVVADFSNDNSKAYWKDSRDFSQSTDLDDNSLLAEAIELAEEEHDKNMPRSRGLEDFSRDAEPSTHYHDKRAQFDHHEEQKEYSEEYRTGKKSTGESYAGQKHTNRTQHEQFYKAEEESHSILIDDESQWQYANQRTFGTQHPDNLIDQWQYANHRSFGTPMNPPISSYHSKNISHLHAEHPSYNDRNHLSPATLIHPLHQNISDDSGTSAYFNATNPSYEGRNQSSPATNQRTYGSPLKTHHPIEYGNRIPRNSHIEQPLHSKRNQEPPASPAISYLPYGYRVDQPDLFQQTAQKVEEKEHASPGQKSKSILKAKSHGKRANAKKEKKSVKVKKSKKKILSLSSLDFSESSDGSYNSEYYTDNHSARFDDSFDTSYETDNSSYYSDTTDEYSRRKRRKDSSRRNRSRSRNSRNRSRSRSSHGKSRRRKGTKSRSSSRKRSARRSSHR